LINDNTGNPVEFINSFQGSFASAFSFNFGRGPLPSTSGIWDPHKRFVSDGFIFADNPVYNNDSNHDHLKFPRLYYKSGTDVLNGGKILQREGRPLFSISDILEGGHLYVKKQQGESFSVSIADVLFTDDDFQFVEDDELGNFIIPDINGDGSVNLDDNLDLLQDSLEEGNFISTQDVFGIEAPTTNPYNSPSSYYELLTQFNSYPAITLVGLDEVKEFPGHFSLLLYDAKRNSSFQITFTHLAEVISEIISIVGGALLPGGSVNITAPMLTNTQIQNFFSTENSADLNADGSVSTADLIEFLTAFGQDVGGATPSIEANTAFSYHNGFISSSSDVENIIELDSPYYPATSLPDITSNSTTFDSSYGSINFIGSPIVPIGDTGTYQGSNFFTSALIAQNLFDNGNNEALEVFWRLHTYITQVELNPGVGTPFGAHESPALFVFGEDNQPQSLLGSTPMPEGNTYCFPGFVFDQLSDTDYFNQSDFVYSNMFSSGENLYVNSGPLFTYGGIVFENVPQGGVGENPPPWASSNILSRNFVRLGDRSTTTSSLLSANARFEVTVQGYVCCGDGQLPIIPIFLRMSGLSNAQNNLDPLVPSFSDVVYLLGHVDMSSNVQYDQENDERYKTFSFVRDFNDYVYPTTFGDADFALNVANTMPSQINASSVTHFNFFSFQTVDFAKSVFITAARFNYKNSRSATLIQ
tara:strand:- start:5496 stop:7595 length:2100 start_codon:yes stop_codon:yes gene_type:complete